MRGHLPFTDDTLTHFPPVFTVHIEHWGLSVGFYEDGEIFDKFRVRGMISTALMDLGDADDKTSEETLIGEPHASCRPRK